MNKKSAPPASQTETPVTNTLNSAPHIDPAAAPRSSRAISIALFWLKLILQPIIAIAVIVGLVFALGYAQKQGLFMNAVENISGVVDDGIEYVCPMLCVPPSKEPGNCPVCGMKLQATEATDSKDFYGLTIDPAARRLSNIQTVVAATIPLIKKIKAFGRIGHDETSQATISAYVDGRLEKMIVGYTGAEVKKGEQMALLYSPDLYSAQVEMLESKKALAASTSLRERIVESNRRMVASSRQRLMEFGLPESLVEAIETSGEALRRIGIVSPISGTVVEKMAVEGEYVKMGSPLFKIVDLSNVWLMLELFPEDANLIRYGQEVSVTLQSLPGKQFQGRIAFIDPQINTKTQTIPVRVVISNEAGLIRIGDFASAFVHVNVNSGGKVLEEIYDPQLAGKWISPMHPNVVRDEPGQCPICGVDLVPAAEFGFVSYQPEQQGAVVVPRNAVLIAGDASVAFVETNPGRFEFRQVQVGEMVDGQIAIVSGIQAGERVVSKGAFTLDAAFNMAGKPSLVDPTKISPKDETDNDDLTPSQSPEDAKKIEQAMAQLSPEDRAIAEAQEICPVANSPLGGMGVPIKVDLDGRPVFICCEGCRKDLVNDPKKYFAILDQFNRKRDDSSRTDEHQQGTSINQTPSELPPMELPRMELPTMELPPINPSGTTRPSDVDRGGVQ